MSVEFDRDLPESLTQGLLIGKLLIGGLGVHAPASVAARRFAKANGE